MNKENKKILIKNLIRKRVTKSAIIWFGHIGTYMATGVCWDYTISNSYLKQLYFYKLWIIENNFWTIEKKE